MHFNRQADRRLRWFAVPAASTLTNSFGKKHDSKLVCIDQFAFFFDSTLLLTLQRRHLWVAAPSQKYPAHFAAIQLI
jgi:hypothetical protein